MCGLILLFIHLLAIIARLVGPGGQGQIPGNQWMVAEGSRSVDTISSTDTKTDTGGVFVEAGGGKEYYQVQ
jgi:hypothetical protein